MKRVTKVEAGDRAPSFTLTDAEEQALSLDDVLRSGRNVLLVFLRHLG